MEIEVRNLSKEFMQDGNRVEALKGVNLSIQKGDIYGIIGMSGAGKSTLVRCLNYLERPTEGEVLIDGVELGKLSEKELLKQRSEIAMIFQHFNLLMQKTVLDNVAFPLHIRGVKKKERQKRALELLEIVGLSEKAKAYPAQLSGGQKQRVAIARALACNPKILLCDEATSALDPQTTASILELLREINEKYRITIVIITHQMSVVREICHRVAIVENGRIVEEGAVEDNILWADTKNVGGIAKGEMVLGLPKERELCEEMKAYLRERGLAVEEVSDADVVAVNQALERDFAVEEVSDDVE